MTIILLFATVALGIVLADTRRRLSRLEQADENRTANFTLRSLPPLPAHQIEPDCAHHEQGQHPAQSGVEESFVEHLEDGTLQQGISELPIPEDAAPVTRFGFEDLFGRRLPVWTGGVTLLVATALLVKYSIDSGLLSPWVRVTMGALFGATLIMAAEIARKMERFVQDTRIAQAFAGAGVGSVYVATLAASNLYGLLGPATAFICLSAITLLAMSLATRFGAPCALLALSGGLATPALVQSSAPSIPLLCGYLAMVIGSLTLLSRRQRWFWLGVLALTGGMGWTALIIATTELSRWSTLSIGLLVLLLGMALPMICDRADRQVLIRAAASGAAALQMGLQVATGGYDGLNWGLYALLSLAFIWLVSRIHALRPMMVLPLGIALLLIYVWPDAPPEMFGVVLLGIVAIFGSYALRQLWRPRATIVEALQVATIAVGGFLAARHQEFGFSNQEWAMIALSFAALPGIAVVRGWPVSDRGSDWRFPALSLTGGFLLLWASSLGFERWFLPVAMAAVSGTLLLISYFSRDRRISDGALVYLGGAILILLGTGALNHELNRLFEAATVEHPSQALARWCMLAVIMGGFARRYAHTTTGRMLASITALLAYGTMAQFIPALWLAIAVSAGLFGLAMIARRHVPLELVPPMITLGIVTCAWMAMPVLVWMQHALPSTSGTPMFVGGLPESGEVLRRLIIPTLLCGLSLRMLRETVDSGPSQRWHLALAIPAIVAVHSLYKQLFAIDDASRFIALGFAERTLWEALLVGAGLLWGRLGRNRDVALMLVVMGIAHNFFYSLILHNPLWSEQAVGPFPLANLLLPAFGMAFVAPQLIGFINTKFQEGVRHAALAWHMGVMLLFTFASLRQLFCGSLFAFAKVGQTESIAWSVMTIALGIGWLIWGIRSESRSWRIGSLLIMLAAAGKVFLVDASGLEGLFRIMSFLALGFSLIGIGWLYSRFLRREAY